MKTEPYKPVYMTETNTCEWCQAKDPGTLNPTARTTFLEHIAGAGNLCPACVARLFRFLDHWTHR